MSREHSLQQVIEVRESGRVRVGVRTELDVASAPRVSESLRTLREDGEAVVLDLDEVAFVDMDLRMVLAAAENSSRDGWSFGVTAGSAPVRRLISLVKLDRPLPLNRGST